MLIMAASLGASAPRRGQPPSYVMHVLIRYKSNRPSPGPGGCLSEGPDSLSSLWNMSSLSLRPCNFTPIKVFRQSFLSIQPAGDIISVRGANHGIQSSQPGEALPD